MARYDRIAPLSAPGRAHAFPCWPVLRDLEVPARATESARRARIRFLVLRPVARLARMAPAEIARESLALQAERALQELAQLPARDAERSRLLRILESVTTSPADATGRALLAYVEFALANATPGAAMEYAECCVDLMRAHGHPGGTAAALRMVALALTQGGNATPAIERAGQACELAQESGDRLEWLRANGQLAAALRVGRDFARAHAVLANGLRQAREWNDESLIGSAHAHLCREAFATQHFDLAVDHGWSALRSLDNGLDRTDVLHLLAQALCRLDLWQAAARCFVLVGQHSNERSYRALAFAGSALCAAHDHNPELFTGQRAAALRELGPLPQFTRAEVHTGLGWAAIFAADLDLAREHVGAAIALLGDHAPEGLRARAEAIGSALERHSAQDIVRIAVRPVTEQIRRIATQLEQSAGIGVAAS